MVARLPKGFCLALVVCLWHWLPSPGSFVHRSQLAAAGTAKSKPRRLYSGNSLWYGSNFQSSSFLFASGKSGDRGDAQSEIPGGAVNVVESASSGFKQPAPSYAGSSASVPISRNSFVTLGFGSLYVGFLYTLLTAESNPMYRGKVRDTIAGAVPTSGLRVLEIGIADAPNLEFYPSGTKLVGLDANLPGPDQRLGIESRARERGVRMYWTQGDIQKMPFDDGFFDAVIMTKVLCSVRDQMAALQEVSRVLKKGGRMGYVEHVAADPDTLLEKQQLFIDPAQQAFAGNCHLHRDTDAMIRRCTRDESAQGQGLFDHVDTAERYQVWQMWPIAQQAAGIVTK